MFLNGEKIGWIACLAAASSNKKIKRTQKAAPLIKTLDAIENL